MKFTDGQWMLKNGVTMLNPHEAKDYTIEKDSITIYAPFKNINHRGDTIDGGLLTIRLYSPLTDIMGIKITHFMGQMEKKPEFELNAPGSEKFSVEDNEKELVVKSGELKAIINKENYSISFYNNDQYLTRTNFRNAGYITCDGKNYLREQLDLRPGECVYGLGERFTAFVKNGQSVDIWNEDGGTSSEQTYKNIPFYLTNKGYGVFVNQTDKVSYEVASENVFKVQFSVEGESLEYFLINGGTPKKVIENYAKLSGYPALPPRWSFGLWLSTSFTTSYDEKTVSEFINGMEERDLPLSVFHFDCFWMKEYHLTDLKWDENVFPDPEGMLKRLKARGLKICLWINPYIAQRSVLFEDGRKNGYLLKKPNGDIWQWNRWQAGMAIVDFTNPDARKWFAGHLEKLVDIGVDSFKTDFGERIPVDVEYFDGSGPQKMHNYYTYMYNKTVFDLLEKKLGKNNAVVFSRSATTGCQKYPVHWGGDCWGRYESMAETLRGGLSLGLCGFGFWSHDIGGFENKAPADLYKRWLAFGLLSSHSRLHGSTMYKVPWYFDDESVDVLRYFSKLKNTLMPYIFAASVEAVKTGVPVLRAMMLEFPDDPGCNYLDMQYMFGESLLVAPVFSSDNTVDFYLPEGNWTSLLTGVTVKGGRWYKEKHGYLSLPLYVRENSILAIGENEDVPDYDYCNNVKLHYYSPVESLPATCIIHDESAKPVMEINAVKKGNELTITLVKTVKNWTMIIHNTGIPKKCTGASFSVSEKENEVVINPDKPDGVIVVVF